MATKLDPRLIPELNIGLVGHVDHGKTTLNYAITGKWTDTHSEEIKRGITIRLGYSDFTIYRCGTCRMLGNAEACPCGGEKGEPQRTVSIVDAPGHETLMTTMLSGVAIMDAALLVIAADEKCPQPQTKEHLTALTISGMKHIIVVQNKVDLITIEQAKKNYQEIRGFLKGTVAESASIIPVSAQQRVNIHQILEAILQIPLPKRQGGKETRMLLARSFDVNKPGTEIGRLRGGIVGGSVVQGTLAIGDDIEIRPGVKTEKGYISLKAKVTGLIKGGQAVEEAGPGGLLGVATELDPALTKADSLAGNVLGRAGKLPPVVSEVTISAQMLDRAVGTKEELKIEPIKMNEPLLLTVGISRTVGTVNFTSPQKVRVKLKIPVCADKGERVAVSRQVSGRWRLIGWGEVIA